MVDMHPCPMDPRQWDLFDGAMAIFCQIHKKYWLGFGTGMSRNHADMLVLTRPAPSWLQASGGVAARRSASVALRRVLGPSQSKRSAPATKSRS